MRALILLLLILACGCAHHHPEPVVRYLARAELKPSGAAPGAQHRLIATRADGSKEYALVLARGDEVMTALSDFARVEQVTAASFSAIGAVRGAEVGWFDFEKQQYKAMRHDDQLEVLSLLGDIGVGGDGKATVHAHATLGRENGRTFGGHLIAATVWPTLEVFVTTYPQPLEKAAGSKRRHRTVPAVQPVRAGDAGPDVAQPKHGQSATESSPAAGPPGPGSEHGREMGRDRKLAEPSVLALRERRRAQLRPSRSFGVPGPPNWVQNLSLPRLPRVLLRRALSRRARVRSRKRTRCAIQ